MPPATVTSRAVCVLGFGRSGTSMTMRVLNLLGVDVGPAEALMPAHATGNPRGYWEPRWIVDLNDAILERLGGAWWNPPRAEPGWHERADLEPLRRTARQLLDEHYPDASLWGWKDPRTTLTLPFWRALIGELDVVICLRNPADAVASFEQRPWHSQPTEDWAALWLQYTAQALAARRHSRSIVTFYEDWFQDPQLEISRLAGFLGTPTPPPESETGRAILASIDSGLRHHGTPPAELAADERIPLEARAGFLLLRGVELLERQAGPSDERLGAAAERLWLRLRDVHRERRDADAARGRELDRLAAEVDALRSSWSWRLTAPLRAVGRRVAPRRPRS